MNKQIKRERNKMKKSYVLVNAKKWNTSENVLFVMDSDDFRLEDLNHEIIGEGTFKPGKRIHRIHRIGGYLHPFKMFECNKVDYMVFADRSACEY